MVMVTIDLPAPLVLEINERAHDSGLPVDEICKVALTPLLTGRLDRHAHTITLHERIRALVSEDGWCDAEVGAAMHMTTRQIAEIRRSMGLPANRRKWS